MVGIKPAFAPLPLCFWCKEEVESSANFQELDETWTFDRCLFEYQTELWRPADGRQIAFQTGSSVCARSSGGRGHLRSPVVLQRNRCTNLSPTLLSSLYRYGPHLQTVSQSDFVGSQSETSVWFSVLYEVKVLFSQPVQGGTAATLLPRSGLKLQLGVIVFPPPSWHQR